MSADPANYDEDMPKRMRGAAYPSIGRQSLRVTVTPTGRYAKSSKPYLWRGFSDFGLGVSGNLRPYRESGRGSLAPRATAR